ACTDTPACDPTQLTRGITNAAGNAAVATWQAAGREADFSDPIFHRWLLSQIPIELGCRAEPFVPSSDSGPSPPQADTFTASAMGTCGAGTELSKPPAEDEEQTPYCGPEYGNWYNVRCDSCLNQACYRHDGCTASLCVRLGCQFAGNGDCDSCFFDGAHSCIDTAQYWCNRRIDECQLDPVCLNQVLSEGPCVEAQCIQDVSWIARHVGHVNSSAPPCKCNRTICGGADGCESRCAGCDSRFHSICELMPQDPNLRNQIAVRAIVGTESSFTGCSAGCGECGWCLLPNWPDGCGGFSSQ